MITFVVEGVEDESKACGVPLLLLCDVSHLGDLDVLVQVIMALTTK